MPETMSRRSTGRPFSNALLIVVVLVSSVLAGCSWPGSSVDLVHEPVSQELGAATQADVEIALAVGQLRLGALEQPGTLIAGEIAYPERHSVSRDFTESGDTASFSLRELEGDTKNTFRFNQQSPVWDLGLSPTTALRLTVETGVGENLIDLAELEMTEVTLRSGVGATTLTLPRTGQIQALVEGGVGATTIRIPAGVGVQLKVEAGLGNTKVPATYRQQGDVYVSPDYDTAPARVELQANTGIGTITIEQSGG